MSVPSEYAAAREVLLDATDALGSQVGSAILVGAQAVYLRCGDGDLAVAPMTTDADLALNTDWISDEPELYAAMESAGFVPGSQPGTWLGRHEIAVDLMVVPHQSGRGGSARAARVPPHRKGIARITRGLEAALVDHHEMWVTALAAGDPRRVAMKVAGPAALLVAKLIKLGDRMQSSAAGRRDRVVAKDALDVLRLMRATRTDDLVAGLGVHGAEEHAEAVSEEAIGVLREHGLGRGEALPWLASQAVGEDAIIEAAFVALAEQLVASYDS
jgi:hypothetical protein